ncbi:MAG TPA: hypothetical protein VF092_04850 [Longimicrobium sp.]
MLTNLQPQPVDAGPEGRGYVLDAGGRAFGFLYVTPSSYTLAWDGSVDFAAIEQKAIESLAVSTGLGSQLASGRRMISVFEYARASMIFRVECGWDQLIEFRLDDPADYAAYCEALRHSRELLFARYDFHDSQLMEYSFIAQNPLHPTDERELAIILPAHRPCSAELLRWITSHHTAFAQEHSRVDFTISAQTICQLVGSMADSEAPAVAAA